MAHALVASVGGFFAARVFLGVSEGGNFPAAIKAVALWFPKRERAFATAIFNSGTNVGAIIAPALVPVIAVTSAGAAAFVFAGLVGLPLAVPVVPVLRRAREVEAAADGRARLHPQRQGRSRRRRHADRLAAARSAIRQTWAFIVAKFLTDPVWWFFLIWLPDYFKKTRGLDIKHSWIHLVTIYAIVTVLSIAGRMAHRRTSRSGGGA